MERRGAVRFAGVASMLLTLVACGGGSNSSTTDTSEMPVAFEVLGQPDFISKNANRGTPTNALGLAQPLGGIATDGEHFYVADYGNNRILGWNTIPSGPAVEPDFVIGQSDFTGNQPGTAATSLALPSSVQIANGKLVVADSGNNRVLYWSQIPSQNGAKATNVIGQADFARVTNGVAASQFYTPYGVASDGTQIYVADSNNNRVLKFDSFPIANGAAGIEVFGQNTFTARVPNDDNQDGTADATPSARTMSSPTGVTIGPDGVLYVTDRNNHRILFFPG